MTLTTSDLYIAGDWGTTRLRLLLCKGEQVLERLERPSVAPSAAAGATGFAAALDDLTAEWRRAHGVIPVWLSGMVGSRNGWRETSYVQCPADAAALAHAMLHFSEGGHAIAIAPGLTCINPLGAPDVLRGEETQVIGVLDRNPALARGSYVLALPGTHSKWVLVEDGRIVRFQTSFSGELYALLCDHSTLSRASHGVAPLTADPVERSAFDQGAARARELRGVPLSYLLFETRSRQLVGGLQRGQALAFLSGLIIGQEVLGAIELFEGAARRGHCVPLIGAPVLIELYSRVLATHDVCTVAIDAQEATHWGLRTLAAMARNRAGCS